MKKLVLSLVLTLGVSGLALANNSVKEKVKQPIKSEVTDKEEGYLIVDIYEVEGICDGDDDGEFEIRHEETGDACKGTEGGVIFQYHHPFLINNCL